MLGAASPAEAVPFRVGIGGAAGMLTTADQRDWLRYDSVGYGAHALLGLRILGPLHVDLRGSYMSFPSPMGRGSLGEVGLGPSVDFDQLLRGVVFTPNVTINVGQTGPYLLPTLHTGLRTVFEVSREFAVGPEVSYGRVFWKNAPSYSSDAGFVTVGITLVWTDRGEAPKAKGRPVPPVDTEIVRDDSVPELDITVLPDDGEVNQLLDDALPFAYRQETVILAPVLFESNSARLLPSGEVALFAARDAIRDSVGEYEIEGHADGRGTDEYNLNLATERATRVRDWLIHHGVDPARLRVLAVGEGSPLVPEVDEHARTLQRRVTFKAVAVVDGDGPSPLPSAAVKTEPLP